MSFFRIFLIIIFISAASNSFADESTENQNATDKAQEIVNQAQEEDEVPLNDPFAGNEGTSSMSNIPEDEQEDEMSLYNFKLVGLISGKDHSYISLVNSGGEIITLTLGQYLGKNKFVDLRLSEAIFEKEDKTFIIIDFNNQIREANEY
tara:strand:- start:348 stop:794 length:447 start_codon:yes stop_codon:yes gene_type:complete